MSVLLHSVWEELDLEREEGTVVRSFYRRLTEERSSQNKGFFTWGARFGFRLRLRLRCNPVVTKDVMQIL